jgi:hypothetical protein
VMRGDGSITLMALMDVFLVGVMLRRCHCPYTHLQTWRSLQPTWCVLGGTSLSPNPLSPRFGLLSSREAKGGRPYLNMSS